MAAATLLLCSFAARPSAHDPVTTRVTFDREIRAILDARCGACHSSRGSAPIPFTTYEEVRPWARAIKEQVLSRRMPKWHAARGFGAARGLGAGLFSLAGLAAGCVAAAFNASNDSRSAFA